MNGLVRFQELADGQLWATVTPDHDVIDRVYPYFSRRMPGENWVVYDAKRGKGLRHIAGRVDSENIVVPEPLRRILVTNGRLPEFVAPKDPFFELWRTFFDAVAIEDRKNPKLQRQCMPKRYWRNLPEKSS